MPELLQPARELFGRSCLIEKLGHRAIALLEFPGDIKELCRSGKIVAPVVRLIQEPYESIPSRADNGIRAHDSGPDKLQVGSLRNFLLNRLPEKKAGQEPLEELFFLFRKAPICGTDSVDIAANVTVGAG